LGRLVRGDDLANDRNSAHSAAINKKFLVFRTKLGGQVDMRNNEWNKWVVNILFLEINSTCMSVTQTQR
jgi:hypothetical protein